MNRNINPAADLSDAANGSPMIEVSSLSKHFGAFPALQDVSFVVGTGESAALWGPNGAGKTTVLRCLLGLATYEGEILVDGIDPTKDARAVRSKIGYVPQDLPIHPMTAGEMVSFIARLKRCPEDDAMDRLSLLGIEDQVNKEVGALSGGLRQRLSLALALIGDPLILLLDEPTANLDAQGRAELLQILLDLKRRGMTVMFSSHRPEDVTALADHVLSIDGGILESVQGPRDFANASGAKSRLVVFLRNGHREIAEETLERMGLTATGSGKVLSVAVPQDRKAGVLTELTRDGVDIEDFEWERVTWTQRS